MDLGQCACFGAWGMGADFSFLDFVEEAGTWGYVASSKTGATRQKETVIHRSGVGLPEGLRSILEEGARGNDSRVPHARWLRHLMEAQPVIFCVGEVQVPTTKTEGGECECIKTVERPDVGGYIMNSRFEVQSQGRSSLDMNNGRCGAFFWYLFCYI